MTDLASDAPSQSPESEKPPQNGFLSKARAYGTIVMSALAMVIFGFAVLWAFITDDHDMKTYLVGASGTMAMTAINWWLGSSKGSEKKDDIIAASPPVGLSPR